MELEDLKYYDKKFIYLNDVKLKQKERVELLIFLVNITELDIEIRNYYLLLGGRGIITCHRLNNMDYFIQNARILLKTLNQKKVYFDELEEYEGSEENDDHCFERLYVRYDNRFVKRDDISKKTEKRETLYLKLLSLDIKIPFVDNKYALQDDKRYGIILEDKAIEIKDYIPTKPEVISIGNCNERKSISFKIEDLIVEASEIDAVLSPKNPYRAKVIKENIFKKLENEKYSISKSITIDAITNIVGQVGAGKTTFVDALLRYISKKNKKIILIQATVNKVLEKSEELNNISVKAIPVIGGTAWSEHIEKARDGMDFLGEYNSSILTSACILGGLIKEHDVTIGYGKEPCKKIYKYFEKGVNKNTLNCKVSYKCPYYYKCPRTRTQKDLLDADVIVTTTPALISMFVGISGMTVFQYALEKIDLIIVDEAESELIKADTNFSPIISYDEYIVKNSDISSDYYNKEFKQRIDKSEENKRNFISLYVALEIHFTKIHTLLKESKQGISKNNLTNPFTANMLINICNNKALIPDDIIDDLRKISDVKSKRRYKAILSYVSEIKNKRDLTQSFKEGDWGCVEELDKNQVDIIIFILNVLAFEDLYRKISNLVESNDELPLSTKEIVSQRFEFQQRYIPVSPKGNIFALQYKEYENRGSADLYIVKQFAMGRAMFLRFPWLKLDIDGNPLGPNILLLSGSSFAPKSYANHINEPVKYIIEAEEYKRMFIANSKFEYIDTGIIVSGSGNERYENLRRLVLECKQLIIDKLNADDNILIIVNSYKDVESTKDKLKEILEDTPYKEKVSYLVSDSETEDLAKIRQSNVSQFYSKKSRILVAPAILIERGHNIVDNKGNSAFDVVMFMTRPMANPNDFKSHVPKVNGYIMSEFADKNYKFDTGVLSDMRKYANKLYYDLDKPSYGLEHLDKHLKNDIISTLFVMILQIFGRVCRIGKEEDLKAKAPEVYFLDAAFKANKVGKFDYLNELVDYLDKIINQNNKDGDVAKTLYEPFYYALKKGKNIYDK